MNCKNRSLNWHAPFLSGSKRKIIDRSSAWLSFSSRASPYPKCPATVEEKVFLISPKDCPFGAAFWQFLILLSPRVFETIFDALLTNHFFSKWNARLRISSLNKKLDKIIGCDIKSFRSSLPPSDGKKYELSIFKNLICSIRKEVVLQSFKTFFSVHTFHLF